MAMRSWFAVVGSFLFGAPAWGACADYASEPKRLVELEDTASRGRLDADQLACLETAYAAAGVQTTKGKISRVLLVNAYASNTTDWARLVDRHLAEVDQSDPDIAYLYAFYLYNHDPITDQDGAGKADAVVRWTDVGLERRDTWTGDVYVSRVGGLMRLRTLAQLERWTDLEKQAVKDPAFRGQAEDAQNRTKTAAREWLEFARSSGGDTRAAYDVCVSAGSTAFCGETSGG